MGWRGEGKRVGSREWDVGWREGGEGGGFERVGVKVGSREWGTGGRGKKESKGGFERVGVGSKRK